VRIWGATHLRAGSQPSNPIVTSPPSRSGEARQVIAHAILVFVILLLLTVSSGTWRVQAVGHLGHHIIVSRRIINGKILTRAVLCLLLCGIFAGELPELLSLTDNTANDFTVRSAYSVVPHVRLNASKDVRIADRDSRPAPNLFFSHLSPFEKAELVPSEVFILYSILRT
jgi:hypothetical protein